MNKQLYEVFYSYLRRRAEERMDAKMPAATEEAFGLFEKNGNRLVYDTIYRIRREFLTIFGVLALADYEQTGTVPPDVLRKLESVITEVLDERCWALPAHLSTKDPDWETAVDLMSAETGQNIAELSVRLGDVLPQDLVLRMKREVHRRVFEPMLVHSYGWEGCDHNWNAVICGNIGSACLFLLDEEPELREHLLGRVCKSLPAYLAGFAADGTCMEGLGYYYFGFTHFMNFALQLRDADCGRENLLEGEHVRKIAEFYAKCYFPNGGTVSFSDNSEKEVLPLGLALILQKEFGAKLPNVDPVQTLLNEKIWRFVNYRMDLYALLEAEEDVNTQAELPSFHVQPEAKWVMATSKNAVGFACKGGCNLEAHNHNDVGSFLYRFKDTQLLVDLGAGEYTANYFNSRRYETFCNNSFSHNVPIVNGKGQGFGAEFRCSRFDVESGRVEMELAEAYEDLKGFRRVLNFDAETGTLTINDSFQSDVPVTENLNTLCQVRLASEGVYLQEESAAALIQIPGVDILKDVKLNPVPHNDHYGVTRTVWQIQWPAMPDNQIIISVLDPREAPNG